MLSPAMDSLLEPLRKRSGIGLKSSGTRKKFGDAFRDFRRMVAALSTLRPCFLSETTQSRYHSCVRYAISSGDTVNGKKRPSRLLAAKTET